MDVTTPNFEYERNFMFTCNLTRVVIAVSTIIIRRVGNLIWHAKTNLYVNDDKMDWVSIQLDAVT